MTENSQLLILIVVVLVSNLITYVVTWHYWSTKVNTLLRAQALEHEGRDQELTNARLMSKAYGDLRAPALANMEEDIDEN